MPDQIPHPFYVCKGDTPPMVTTGPPTACGEPHLTIPSFKHRFAISLDDLNTVTNLISRRQDLRSRTKSFHVALERLIDLPSVSRKSSSFTKVLSLVRKSAWDECRATAAESVNQAKGEIRAWNELCREFHNRLFDGSLACFFPTIETQNLLELNDLVPKGLDDFAGGLLAAFHGESAPSSFELAQSIYVRLSSSEVPRLDLSEDIKRSAYRGFSDYMGAMLIILQKVNYEPASTDREELRETCLRVLRDQGVVQPEQKTMIKYMMTILRGSDAANDKYSEARKHKAKMKNQSNV